MKVKALKFLKLERYILALIMTIIMFFIAEFSGQKEIIFPEVLAIMTGAWIAKSMPWNVNKRRIFLLTCIAAFAGVAIVKFIPIALFWQVFLCFIISGVSLILMKSNFIPIISAIILPVYLQTDTWVYSIAVSVMTLVIISVQWIMEKFHMRRINHYNPVFDIKAEIKKWLKLFVVFAVISALPITSKNIFLLAPPLIVTFVTFANTNSSIRKKSLNVYSIIVFASIIGTFLRLILNLYFHLPMALCVIPACLLLFLVFDYTRIQFPPAGAILLLPMILRIEDLKLFPLEVSIGAGIVIFIATTFFKVKK